MNPCSIRFKGPMTGKMSGHVHCRINSFFFFLFCEHFSGEMVDPEDPRILLICKTDAVAWIFASV